MGFVLAGIAGFGVVWFELGRIRREGNKGKLHISSIEQTNVIDVIMNNGKGLFGDGEYQESNEG